MQAHACLWMDYAVVVWRVSGTFGAWRQRLRMAMADGGWADSNHAPPSTTNSRHKRETP